MRSRLSHRANSDLLEGICICIHNILSTHNPEIRSYLTTAEVLTAQAQNNPVRESFDVELQFIRTRNRRDCPPTKNAVVAMFDGTNGLPPADIDFCAFKRSTGEPLLQTLKVTNDYVDPMSYPLLFPYGEKGWNPEIRYVGGNHRVTLIDFYSYRLSVRTKEDYLFSTEKLFQQFVVDAYVKAESNRLSFLRFNQDRIRVDTLQGLTDFVHGQDESGNPAGILLPSSFYGGPRCMAQLYYDSMAMVRRYGKPDIFITFTCNPSWREITENLFHKQRAQYRPDLVCRVFSIKLKALMSDLTNGQIFGTVIAFT